MCNHLEDISLSYHIFTWPILNLRCSNFETRLQRPCSTGQSLEPGASHVDQLPWSHSRSHSLAEQTAADACNAWVFGFRKILNLLILIVTPFESSSGSSRNSAAAELNSTIV